jgi:hypothetical protein
MAFQNKYMRVAVVGLTLLIESCKPSTDNSLRARTPDSGAGNVSDPEAELSETLVVRGRGGDAELRSTRVRFPSDALVVDARVRLSIAQKPSESADNPAVLLGTPLSDVVKVEVLDAGTGILLPKDSILSGYRFSQRLPNITTGQEISAAVIELGPDGSEVRSSLIPADEVEGLSLLSGGVEVAVTLQIPHAIAWFVLADEVSTILSSTTSSGVGSTTGGAGTTVAGQTGGTGSASGSGSGGGASLTMSRTMRVCAARGAAMTESTAIGAGTAADPHVICNKDQLIHLANNCVTVCHKHFFLGSDIDLQDGAGMVPIGTSSVPFVGVFDGGEREIKRLRVDLELTQYVGLFGSVSAGAIIKNLSLRDTTIIGDQGVGCLAGNVPGIFQHF